jgi:hypothetical protein
MYHEITYVLLWIGVSPYAKRNHKINSTHSRLSIIPEASYGLQNRPTHLAHLSVPQGVLDIGIQPGVERC